MYLANNMTLSIFSIIVLYNPDVPTLIRLVDSIAIQVSKIVLVDNGSNNIVEVKQYFQGFDQVEIIEFQENLGIAKAHNTGISFAKKRGASHVLIFDQDSYASPNLVSTLVRAEGDLLTMGKKVAAVGPAFVDPRTNNNYPFSRIDGFSLKSIYPRQGEDPIATSFLISSGSLIRISVLSVVGLMKEEFFIDYVDIEWGLRANSFGYESFGIPNAMMEHSVGDNRLKLFGREISIHSPLRRYYLARNGIFMMKLPYVPWKYKVRELVYTVSRVLVFLCFVPNKLKYIKYISIGWFHGVIGKSGKLDH